MLLAPAAAPGPAAGQARGYSIERFAVTIEVRPDSSLSVREAITFNFRGSHQGVYRTVPVRYTRAGLDFVLRLDAVRVWDEGLRPLRTEVKRAGRYVRIKAWVPGAVNASRTVIIAYRVRRGLFTVDDHQELYWNVTGNEWAVPIRAAEAVVASPEGVGAEGVQAVAYTGPWGAAGTDYALERQDRLLLFSTTRALRAREGLTIAVAWPPGAIGRPSALQEAAWFLGDNWPLGLPVLTLLLAVLAWRAWGRDPATHRSIKPEYAPPEGLAPAEAGTLVDESAEPRDVTATLVDLAVRGYLRIQPAPGEDDGEDFRLVRLKPALEDPALKPFERFVLAKFFGEGGARSERLLSEVRRDYDNVFPPMRERLYQALVAAHLFPVSPARVRAAWLAAGLGLLALAGALLAWTEEWLGVGSGTLALGLGTSGLVLAGVSRIMPRKTWRGARMLVHVRGFQEFLERAEKDRLRRLPPDTLHRWLPWALALGVAERWILGFEGLPVEPPAWFGGGEVFSLRGYHRAVSTFGRRTEQALLTSRRGKGGGWSGGSGFSGGSSGGGMGGGGGGTF